MKRAIVVFRKVAMVDEVQKTISEKRKMTPPPPQAIGQSLACSDVRAIQIIAWLLLVDPFGHPPPTDLIPQLSG